MPIIYLTKHPAQRNDRPAHASLEAGAGAPGITDEMIDVGTEMLIESGYLAYEGRDGVRLLMRTILVACLSRATSQEIS